MVPLHCSREQSLLLQRELPKTHLNTTAQNTSPDKEAIDAPQNTSSKGQERQSEEISEMLAIRVAQAKKCKPKTSLVESGLQVYMARQKRQPEEMYSAKQKH